MIIINNMKNGDNNHHASHAIFDPVCHLRSDASENIEYSHKALTPRHSILESPRKYITCQHHNDQLDPYTPLKYVKTPILIYIMSSLHLKATITPRTTTCIHIRDRDVLHHHDNKWEKYQ